jgi:hypothetical protein
MADETLEIQKVSAETKSAVSRKSAQTLPNRPSEQGYSAEEIKRRFYQPILDAANSALAEIDRVVEEANKFIGSVNVKLDDFIGNTELNAPYKKDLNETVWVLNEITGKYEFLITNAMHGVQDYKEIYVDMYLFGEGGKLVNVNNYDIYTNGEVRLYNENTGGGFVAIARNRDGFVKVYAVTEVDNVIGIAKVAKTNNYSDLDNKPNVSQMTHNEEMISKIISGQQQVNNALNAVNATNAQYATNAGNSDTAVSAQTATRATQDGNGANIVGSYVKQSGNYPNVSVGAAVISDKAKADEDNLNLKANYAKQNGSYGDMNVGKAKAADTATTAASATKATQDANGAEITSTYAKQSGTYANLNVGYATNAGSASSATNAANATNDASGNSISGTYAKQSGTYSGLTAGAATKATQDGNGANIVSNYAKQSGNYASLQSGYGTLTTSSFTGDLYAESTYVGSVTFSVYGIKCVYSGKNYILGQAYTLTSGSGSRFNDVERLDIRNTNKTIFFGGAIEWAGSTNDNNECGSGMWCRRYWGSQSNNAGYMVEDPGKDFPANEALDISIAGICVEI